MFFLFFIATILRFIQKEQDESYNENDNNFLHYFHNYLLQKNINSILSPNQQNKTFIYNLRNYYNEKLSDEVENVTDTTETNATVNKFQFYYSQYPNNIKFKAVSVDSQHTLWSPPNASTGKDYIKFIGKRYFDKYFSVYCIGIMISIKLFKHQFQNRKNKRSVTKH